MKTELWAVGKTSEKYLETGIGIFESRLQRYLSFSLVILPDAKLKTTDGALLKQAEGRLILSKLQPDDYLVLLDEHGQQFSSVEMARWMEKRMVSSPRRLVFLIGGAFGFSEQVCERAQEQLSLSKMTFSHQMIRLFFTEQLYRAMTILKNEPYHNA
jgi:23S rRNA (pseudouridine1915-N3)-methyltransferase